MKRIKNPLRLIAVVLIAMAAVSGYGLYQTMVNWSLAQQTRLNFDGEISNDVQLRFIEGGHAVLTVSFRMNNVGSELDVQIKEISYSAYASSTELLPEEARIGLGSKAFIDSPEMGQIKAGETGELDASMGIQNGTMYMDILRGSAAIDGSYPIQVRAVIRFELVDFPEIGDKLYKFWVGDGVYAS